MQRRRTAVNVSRVLTGVAAIAAAALVAVPAQAGNGTEVSHGTLTELNDSGVTGGVTVLDKGDHLRVNLHVDGFEADQVHLQHIHGFGDGGQATCPDASLAGSDGVLSFADGLPAYGPPLITLGAEFVDGSSLSYSRTFTQTSAGDPVDSLGALDQYVVVVHGMTVGGSYDVTLPVGCAVLTINGS